MMNTADFNKMYVNNKESVFNYLNWKVGNIHDAEDLTAKVFIKAHRTYDADKVKGELSTWLRTICNTVIIDNFRTDHSDKYKAVSDFVSAEGDETFQFISDGGADDRINKEELNTRIANAFQSLKPKYRKIAVLYFVKEKEYTEIAEICNVPLNTVKVMIMRSREKLQGQLKGVRTA